VAYALLSKHGEDMEDSDEESEMEASWDVSGASKEKSPLKGSRHPNSGPPGNSNEEQKHEDSFES
jgi:hypothetical protein